MALDWNIGFQNAPLVAPTFGITRVSDGAVIVATGHAMTAASSTLFTYGQASPVAGVTYRMTWTATRSNGAVISDQFDLTAANTTASWHYGDYQAVLDILGLNDLGVVADPGNRDSVNYSLIQRCGVWSDAMMDGKFAARGWNTPLANTDAQGDVILSDISAKLTIAQLNRSRALVIVTNRFNGQQVSGIDKQVGAWEREAYCMIESICAGWFKLTADRTYSGPSAAVPAGATCTVPQVTYSYGTLGYYCY